MGKFVLRRNRGGGVVAAALLLITPSLRGKKKKAKVCRKRRDWHLFAEKGMALRKQERGGERKAFPQRRGREGRVVGGGCNSGKEKDLNTHNSEKKRRREGNA